jgi:hypothetical protein
MRYIKKDHVMGDTFFQFCLWGASFIFSMVGFTRIYSDKPGLWSDEFPGPASPPRPRRWNHRRLPCSRTALGRRPILAFRVIFIFQRSDLVGRGSHCHTQAHQMSTAPASPLPASVMEPPVAAWSLVLGCSLVLGAWNLELLRGGRAPQCLPAKRFHSLVRFFRFHSFCL